MLKYVKEEKKTKDFSKRIKSEESIDEALVNFLKAKITKAEAHFSRC